MSKEKFNEIWGGLSTTFHCMFLHLFATLLVSNGMRAASALPERAEQLVLVGTGEQAEERIGESVIVSACVCVCRAAEVPLESGRADSGELGGWVHATRLCNMRLLSDFLF